MKTRINFLDNLRTSMILLVIVIHAGLVYESVLGNIWIVVDPVQNSSIGLIRMYLDLFVMFTIFFISGYFIPVSVQKNSVRGFIKSKFKRILLPWILAVVTLIPAYKMIFLYSRGLAQEAWYTYFHVFERTGGEMGFFADNPTQNWLWFLPVLFMFQLMYLALSKTKLLSLKISLKTGIVLTFVVGLVYSMAIASADLRGWYHSPLLHFQRERALIYFLAFLLGSLCYKLRVFDSENRNRKQYIISNVVLGLSLTVFTIIALNFFFNIIDPGREYYFVSELVDRLIYYISVLLSMLSFLHVFIYIFRYRFNKSGFLMHQLNKNSYSVYIIHMIVMGLSALVLLPLPVAAMVKFLLLTTITFIVSNLIMYLYRRYFQRNIVMQLIPLTAFVVAFVSITYSANGEDINYSEEEVILAQEIVKPGIGLHEAVLKEDLETIKLHINAGSDLNIAEPTGGSSPLITASVFGKTKAALLLIEAGADVNFKNNEGSTVLHSAAFFCHTEIVKALIENGVDKKIRNNAGSTALESVSAPFELVEGIYDYFGKTLGPLGLELDYEQLKKTRPIIAEILQNE